MEDIQININGETYTLNEWSGTPLLWVLQVKLGFLKNVSLCGIDYCGDCTVHVDGTPVRSCKTPVAWVIGKNITIEGA